MKKAMNKKAVNQDIMEIFMKYVAIILGIFGLDISIKNHIENHLDEREQRNKCGGFLIVQKYHNKGAFLNAGQSRQKIVAALSVLLTLLLTVIFVGSLTKAGSGMLKCGLSMLLGGAYSNTYDRLKRKYVVDYVSFRIPFKRFRQVVFNIGDFGIMIGAMLIVIGCHS